MGACLSCLGSNSDEGDYNERTSLLNHKLYLDEDLHEELIKQQQRQNELNAIVNDLSDHLIDISTFLSAPPDKAADDARSAASPTVAPAGLDDERQYPYMWSVDEKRKLAAAAAKTPRFAIAAPTEPLYVTF